MHNLRTISKALTNDRVIQVALALLLLSILGFWCANKLNDRAQLIVDQLSTTLLAIALVSMLWDLTIRRRATREVLDAAGVAADVQHAGIAGYRNSYIEGDWETLFNNSRGLDAFVIYANTWRASHYLKLKALLERGLPVNVILPNPENERLMQDISNRFEHGNPDTLRQKIEEAAKEYSGEIGASVFVVDQAPLFTVYNFETSAVITLYSHRRTRDPVPTFTLGPGDLLDFCQKELKALKDGATPWGQAG